MFDWSMYLKEVFTISLTVYKQLECRRLRSITNLTQAGLAAADKELGTHSHEATTACKNKDELFSSLTLSPERQHDLSPAYPSQLAQVVALYFIYVISLNVH
jgi:hypothetical protein